MNRSRKSSTDNSNTNPTIHYAPKTTSRPSPNMYGWNVQVIDKLTATNRNFKYIVHVTLVAKGGNGLDAGGLSYWNADMDGSVNVKW